MFRICANVVFLHCHTERSRSVASAIVAKSTFDKGFDFAQPDNAHKY